MYPFSERMILVSVGLTETTVSRRLVAYFLGNFIQQGQVYTSLYAVPRQLFSDSQMHCALILF